MKRLSLLDYQEMLKRAWWFFKYRFPVLNTLISIKIWSRLLIWNVKIVIIELIASLKNRLIIICPAVLLYNQSLLPICFIKIQSTKQNKMAPIKLTFLNNQYNRMCIQSANTKQNNPHTKNYKTINLNYRKMFRFG